MIDEPRPSDVAAMDQMVASRRDMGRVMGAYWKSLRGNGVPLLPALFAFGVFVVDFELQISTRSAP